MKNIGVKIILVILVLVQIALGIKSALIIKPLILKNGEPIISKFDLVILIVFIVLTLVISIIYGVLVLRKSKNQINTETEIRYKSEVKDKSEQKQIKEEEKRRIQLLNEKKKQIVGELMKDLSLNDGIQKYSEKVLINISKQYNIMQGLLYMKNMQDKVYRKVGTYAYYSDKDLREFTEDIGLSGQVAANKKLLNISNIPEKYITVLSGLGKSSPANLVIFPILYNNESIGIIELASFIKFDSFAEEVLMELSTSIGSNLATLNVEKPLETV